MNAREQTLALITIGVLTLGAVGAGGYFLVWSPLQANRQAAEAIEAELETLQAQQRVQAQAARDLERYKVTSLPADLDLASLEYTLELRHLLVAARAVDAQVTAKPVDNTPRYVPEASKGKPL
ncbi:MAG: hypothetical protein K2V38_07235, partial [Gemmataceae bacterium]|nr:hypothetical protein [Gemmataceae bacterium]